MLKTAKYYLYEFIDGLLIWGDKVIHPSVYDD